MNLGIMQLTSMSQTISTGQTSTKATTANTSKALGETSGKFGEVFSKIVASQNNTTKTDTAKEETVDVEALNNLLDSESIEEVLDLLGISHDEGFLTIQVDGEGQMKSIDESMNLEDLLSLLNMDSEELSKMMENLLDTENIELNNIWQFVQMVNEQAPNIISQLATALQGEHKVTPKEAEQLLQFLKLAQIVGKNGDLMGDQPLQLLNLKDVIKMVVEQVHKSTKEDLVSSTDSTTKQIATVTTQTVQSAVSNNSVTQSSQQQVVKQTENTTETMQTPISTQQTTNTSVKTFTITLPVEKNAQGEALVKEIQYLMNRSQLSNTQGTMKLLLKLYPENLGSIRIEIMQQDGVLSARLLATTQAAKELLDGQLHQLKSAFAHANIQMDRIDIAQSLQETDRNFRDQSMFSNMFRQQQEQENENQDEHDEDEESLSFKDYLINEEV